jgi:hypothetical protein
MTTPLREEVPWEVDQVAERRIAEHDSRFNPPGLGTLAAKDYMRKHSPSRKFKPTGGRRDMHIHAVQNARQAMIDAGIIKPVVVENV